MRLSFVIKNVKQNIWILFFFDAENFSEEITENLPALTYSHTKELEDKTFGGCEMLSIQVKKHQFTPSPCLNFIRRSFLQKHALKFYPHILHEDQLFTSLLYLQAQNVGFIKRNLFHRRLRPSSIMTSRFAWKNMSSYLTVVYELNYFGQKQSHEIQKTIHLFLSQMLDAAVWQAHALPTTTTNQTPHPLPDEIQKICHTTHTGSTNDKKKEIAL